MLSAVAPSLATTRIVLASGSPRRKEIMEKLGIKFEVKVSNFAEDLDKQQYLHNPQGYAVDNAIHKATAVLDSEDEQMSCSSIYIGCDTVVTLDETIIEKPKDPTDAIAMLQRLSGREHQVVSGVAILWRPCAEGSTSSAKPNLHTFHDVTQVKFARLSSQLIEAYVKTGEPLDKAGAYGIQGNGGILVEKINGDYYNVMGMPLCKLFDALLTVHKTKCNVTEQNAV